MENTGENQPKPEESNTQVTNPNPDNITTVNEVPKLKESQIAPEEEEKKENENPPQNPNPNPPQSEENTQIVPKQDENNKPPENQPVNEPPKQEQAKQNDEIQEIEEAKPEIKAKDNRMKFTHPMNDYCSPESVKEIESCPQDKLFPIISKRLNGIGAKLSDILKNHERYTLICLYYKICSIFIQNQNLGINPKMVFQSKDPNSRLKISDFDFQEVLVGTLKCQLTTDELYLILRSLKQKTESLYSYDEFIKNVYNIQQSEEEFKTIYRECSYYFDDYIYSFRHYIQDNQIDYKSAFSRACTGITTLQYELFKKFLTEIGFKLGDEKEYIHLFSSLGELNYTPAWNNFTFQASITLKDNANGLISQKTLFEIADRSDMSEEEFCAMGQVTNKSKKNNEWTKNLMNFTPESKKLHKKQFETFRSVFKNIHKKCVEYDINDLTKFFEESDIDIPPDGDIDVKDFREAMGNIGVPYNVQFDTLVNRLKNMKKKPKDMIKLVEFLSIYNLFLDDDEDDKEDNKSEEKDKDKDKESNIEKEDKNKKYVYKNAHRKFTEDDIDYITEICEGLAEIIIDEQHNSVTNFFRKKDKDNKGYITFDDFKDILYRDLKIDYKSDIENFQVFFDFVLSDKMVEGEDIVETKKIINIIKTYSGRDKPENIQNDEEEEEKEVKLTNMRNQNKKNILFAEEEDLTGTNAPNLSNNLNENIINNKKSENEEIGEDNNQIPIEQISTQINPPAVSFEKIMSEFARYLFTNKIRFSSIFTTISLEKIINNQTISAETLKLGFDNASFPLSDKEFSVIMTHFDPINKSKVVVEELKHEIEKYAPLYFKQNFQKLDADELDKKIKAKGREMEQSAASNFGKNIYNVNLLNGMNKIQNFLERKKLTVEKFFFGKFGNNENLNINEDNFKDTLIPEDQTKKTKTELIPYLTLPEVDAIYKAIDVKLKDKVTLGEIISFFNKYMKQGENIINLNEQSSLNEYINSELKILFDNFDTDKNDIISFDSFFKCLKSLDHKVTMAEALKIPEVKNNSNINRETFNKIMINYIQKELFMQKAEKDYIMNLFKEEDIDNNGFLTRNQIKYLIKNKIGCNLTDAELEEIFNKVDYNQENEIDIRDFVYLLDNINSFQKTGQMENTINTNINPDEELIPIMNLNLNLNMHRKIRPKDFISLYSDLPLSFIPSFTREEQQKNNLLPSSCLKPLTKDDITYEDIFPIESLVYGDKKEIIKDKNKAQELIHPYKKLDVFIPKISCKIYFDDYASGVSSPEETLFESPNSQYKVVGRLLKISLYNRFYKIFVGNAVSIDCIYKKEYQDRWYFEDSDSSYNNNIIIRYNGVDTEKIDVVFEFVLVIQKKVEQTVYTVETSCGWCSIPMNNLQISRKEKLAIRGGSPSNVGDISQEDVRKKRMGFIPKLATLFEGQILSECPIRVKIFKDLTSEEKKYIDYLPGIIVCHSAAMNMISIYRQMLGEYILNHKDYLLKCIKDENDLANMFCKIADVPDAFRVMNEIWREIIIDGSSSDQKNDESFLRRNFEIFVNKINSILYAEKFKYNPLDPTELPRGDIKLMQDRDILLNSILRSDQDKKFNKLEYRMDDYSYKPFTMDEINGQKGNGLLEKIDEIITSISI